MLVLRGMKMSFLLLFVGRHTSGYFKAWFLMRHTRRKWKVKGVSNTPP